MTRRKSTRRTRSVRKYTKEELKVLRIAYGVILVSLGFAVLLHEETPHLGDFFFTYSRYIFGKG
ncbi:MAG TPA: hypothetical protein PLI19_03805, partial [Erysipelotrichaceae bacterium]|nr:hypothetical protein [Erysipelotrichaceae bacterium]